MQDLEIAHMQVSTCPNCGAPLYIAVRSSTDLEPWQQEQPPKPEYSCDCRNLGKNGHTWVKHNG